jgi:DNA primase
MNTIQEIKKIKLSDYISEKVKLTRRGKNLMGICPFHGEKNPSFAVNDTKGYYVCYSCGERGDIIAFEQKINNIDFKQAIKNIATKNNIVTDMNIESTNESEYEKTLLSRIEEFFSSLHLDSFINAKGRSFRGYSKEILSKYDVVVPDWQLLENIKKNTFGKEMDFEMNKILSILNTNGNYFFYGRALIGIRNKSNKIVGFSGRSINSEEPKYLNSAESEIFKKSQCLYNFKNCKKEGSLYVTEGFFDAIALSEQKLNAVALMGISMSSDQLEMISKYRTINLCLDKDPAGTRSTISIAKELIERGHNVYITNWKSERKDIDEVIRSGEEYENVSLIDYMKSNLSIDEFRGKAKEMIDSALDLSYASTLKGDYSRVLGINLDLESLNQAILEENDSLRKEIVRLRKSNAILNSTATRLQEERNELEQRLFNKKSLRQSSEINKKLRI